MSGQCFGSEADIQRLSALPPKADITAAQTNVRFVPKADMPPPFKTMSTCHCPAHEITGGDDGKARWKGPVLAKSKYVVAHTKRDHARRRTHCCKGLRSTAAPLRSHSGTEWRNVYAAKCCSKKTAGMNPRDRRARCSQAACSCRFLQIHSKAHWPCACDVDLRVVRSDRRPATANRLPCPDRPFQRVESA